MSGPRFHYGGKRVERIMQGMKRQELSNLDRFADLICGGDDEANALSPQEAAERMGYSRAYGNAMMQRLREKLGPQAR